MNTENTLNSYKLLNTLLINSRCKQCACMHAWMRQHHPYLTCSATEARHAAAAAAAAHSISRAPRQVWQGARVHSHWRNEGHLLSRLADAFAEKVCRSCASVVDARHVAVEEALSCALIQADDVASSTAIVGAVRKGAGLPSDRHAPLGVAGPLLDSVGQLQPRAHRVVDNNGSRALGGGSRVLGFMA